MVLPMWHYLDRPNDWYSLGAFRADYTEPLVDRDDVEAARELWSWLVDSARCHSAKIARLRGESCFSRAAPRGADRFVAAARSVAKRRAIRYINVTAEREHPYADEQRIRDLAMRLGSKDTRRKINVLSKLGAVSYEKLRGSAIQPLLASFFAMHEANFAGTGRRSQFADAKERAFYLALASHPDLQRSIYMDVLRVGDRLAALHVGFEEKGRVFWYKPAFALDLEKGSPGRVLLAHLFAAAATGGIHEVDLLKGTEGYKQDWSNHVRETITCTLVARRLRDIGSTLLRRWRQS